MADVMLMPPVIGSYTRAPMRVHWLYDVGGVKPRDQRQILKPKHAYWRNDADMPSRTVTPATYGITMVNPSE